MGVDVPLHKGTLAFGFSCSEMLSQVTKAQVVALPPCSKTCSSLNKGDYHNVSPNVECGLAESLEYSAMKVTQKGTFASKIGFIQPLENVSLQICTCFIH